MLQMGQQQEQDLLAGAATVGLGRNWKDVCYSPTAWIYYDYASGDSDPNDGRFHTFNQLYPFGHYYLGWLDLAWIPTDWNGPKSRRHSGWNVATTNR